MNPRLQQIARELNRKKPAEKARSASGTLGETLEAMIQQQVEERVSAELDKQDFTPRNPRLRQLMRGFNAPAPKTDFAQVPELQRTPLPPMGAAIVERDELGRAVQVVVEGRGTLRVERDSLGRIARMVPSDIAPVPAAIEPHELASTRQYNPGEER